MTTAVHNVDQRSPVVSIEHAALPCVVECEQYGPGHAKFVADTSSVIWACGKLLPQHLCEHPDEVRGKRCCELGAGIGLAGATAFALGATDVLLTDCAPAVPLLQLNAERNAAANGGTGGSLRAQELQWGDQAHIDAAGRGAYDVLLGADIVYHQSAEEMAQL
jgi:predicted nicotinamide N-methyase